MTSSVLSPRRSNPKPILQPFIPLTARFQNSPRQSNPRRSGGSRSKWERLSLARPTPGLLNSFSSETKAGDNTKWCESQTASQLFLFGTSSRYDSVSSTRTDWQICCGLKKTVTEPQTLKKQSNLDTYTIDYSNSLDSFMKLKVELERLSQARAWRLLAFA